MLKERRLGRFKVSLEFMTGATIGEGQNLFKDMIIFDVNRNMFSDKVEYLAYHPSFEMIEQGDIYPEYRAVFDKVSPYPKWEKI